jgi:methionyl aminopeptidase
VPSADLIALRQAGRIAAEARALGRLRLATGGRLRDICVAVEDEIVRRGGAPAFPVQIGLNEVAAHFCPEEDEPALAQDGDLAKLDVGVHIDGWVVDTAVTVCVGHGRARERLVAAAEKGLDAALAVAGPGVALARLSQAIDTAVRSVGLRPVANLCGHGVGRWTVHCPPPVPNQVEGDTTTRLEPGLILAIEVFATDGDGRVEERGTGRIYRLDPEAPTGSIDPEVVGVLRAFHGLPFSAPQVKGFPRPRVAAALIALSAAGRLRSYRPLVDPQATAVAQAEHTIYVHEDRIEVLTF